MGTKAFNRKGRQEQPQRVAKKNRGKSLGVTYGQPLSAFGENNSIQLTGGPEAIFGRLIT